MAAAAISCDVDLPDEIWVKILTYCDLTSILQVMLSGPRLYAVTNSSSLWKSKLKQLAGWLPEQDHFLNASGGYKEICHRFCSIFGNDESDACSDRSVLRCGRCLQLCCDAACMQDRDELIIFDFGSKTTWFKYCSDTTGQLSMHPTVGPLGMSLTSDNIDADVLSNGFCPICTRIILRCLPTSAAASLNAEAVEHSANSQNNRFSKAMSRFSLKSFNCLNAAAACHEADLKLTDDAVDCLLETSNACVTDDKAESVESDGAKVTSDASVCSNPRLLIYKFLIRHMLKRNPFFQIHNILFVVCEPTDCNVEMKKALVELLLCELKVPGMCFIPKPIGVALYTGLDTCLVVDSGANHTSISPVVDLDVLVDCVSSIKVGGSHLTKQLLQCIQSKGLDHEIKEGSIDSSQVKRECYLAYNAQVEAKRKIATKDVVIKGSKNDKQKIFEVKLSHELYQVSEDMYLHLNLTQRIVDSIGSLSPAVQKQLVGNIILSGGNCRLAGLALRLTSDLQALLPPELSAAVRVLDPRLMTGRSDAVIGSSYIKKWSKARWITRKDYILNTLNLQDAGCNDQSRRRDSEARAKLSTDGDDVAEEPRDASRRVGANQDYADDTNERTDLFVCCELLQQTELANDGVDDDDDDDDDNNVFEQLQIV